MGEGGLREVKQLAQFPPLLGARTRVHILPPACGLRSHETLPVFTLLLSKKTELQNDKPIYDYIFKTHLDRYLCMYVCVYVCVCTRACVCICVYTCVRVGTGMFIRVYVIIRVLCVYITVCLHVYVHS